MSESDRVRRLAELIVRFGANVQPGQVVSISSEPGKEELARAVADVAYAAGAKFVEVRVFDLHLKRSRAIHAELDSLSYVPPWYGEQILALGAHRSAVITLTGPVEPHLMDDVDPDRLGRDMLPRVRESETVLNDRLLNWTVAPCPTPGWAALVHPKLAPPAALEQLWSDIVRVCRLDEEDPIAAWNARLDRLIEVAGTLTALRLDALHFEGPGTDLTIGLLPTSRWTGARLATAEGIIHAPNLPTEEVFTTPDPERTSGIVTSTKPLFVAGALITGLRVRFEGGRAVEIEAERGAETLRALTRRGPGAARLGEVALVDRESRIGQLGTVFFDTLLDENAASHIALGAGLEMALEGDEDHPRVNRSEIHIDFMIGANDVAVSGITADGAEVPLLRDGAWQI
jgi:aminopeptidase